MVVDFALSLSEVQEKKFLDIIAHLQTVAASEVGHSSSADTPVSADAIKFFTEKM
jgi:hypothetical protein